MGKDIVPSFGRHVTRKAGPEQCLVGRFAIFKLRESPTARRGVFSRVLDHQLNIDWSPSNEGLVTAKTLLFSSDGV
jgi:hypothetical protein